MAKQGMIKTAQEIELIAENGKIIADILRRTAAMAKPGVSTWDLNKFAEEEINKAGGKPAFKNYGQGDNGDPFPAGLCTSVNSVVVHGIPSKKDVLKAGFVVSLDIGMEYKGLYTDTALTVGVGQIDPELQKLLDATRQALAEAIKAAKVGNRIGDIAAATQRIIESAGFSAMRDLVGHGVGYDVHEEPAVPCVGKAGTGLKLQEGMVLAIEPMAAIGDYHLYVEKDGWAIATQDGSPAAHFEHTVAITKKGPRILTQ